MVHGSNSYGIKTAAKTYFNTTPKELTTDHPCTERSIIKNPMKQLCSVG